MKQFLGREWEYVENRLMCSTWGGLLRVGVMDSLWGCLGQGSVTYFVSLSHFSVQPGIGLVISTPDDPNSLVSGSKGLMK